jgi:tetratricopeptide (TPR) repeat protein
MPLTDVCGLEATCGSRDAMAAWNETIEGFLAHDRDTPASLAQALESDGGFVLAWCAKGLFTTLLARAELAAHTREALARAEEALRMRGATARERLYVDALRNAAAGWFSQAVACLERILDTHPRDSLAAKLSHAFNFMLGESRAMLASIERVVARAGLDHPHLGYLLGCLAFALEENGAFRDAEKLGRRALERAPRDAWGLHAVIHVHEMTGRSAQGAEFLTAHAPSFEGCNNFGYHLFWHLALFRLELGDLDGALRVYDERVRSEKTDDFRDVANAASLLGRLELAGAHVGSRWEELGAIGERRLHDRSLVFASLHYALALIGAGRHDSARKLAAGLGGLCAAQGDQEYVAREIGAPAADALIAYSERRYGDAARTLLALRPRLRRIGGSNAQRDFFDQVLIEACIREGLSQQAAILLTERMVVRGKNRFAADCFARFSRGSYTTGERLRS